MSRKLTYLIFVLILGFAVASVANGAAPVPNAGWWKLDEGSGTIAHDSSGNGRHGSVEGAPTWASLGWEGWGGCMRFGGDNDRITVESFDVTGSGITLSAWIKVINFQDDARMISKSQGSGTADHYWAMILSGSGENNLEFRLRTNTGAATRRTSPEGNDVQANEWTHVAVTWDAGDPYMRLYKNSQEIDSVSKAGSAVATSPGARIGIGNQSVSAGPVAADMTRPFGGLIDDVRVYDYALSANEMKELLVAVFPAKASIPSPANGAEDVLRDVVLSWTPGDFADKHDVYFGTVFDDVNNADRVNPLGVLASQGQNANTYDPAGLLDCGQTYYWRVDEVNAPPDFTVYKGAVWQFTTEPFSLPLENVTATASSQFNENTKPENTINGSGLDENDLHSTDDTGIWVSSMAGPQPTWIQYEFERLYKLHQMWVWNHNTTIEPVVGFGIKEAGYAYNTTVDLGDVVAKYVKITANSNWGGIVPQYGLSEVRFFYIPVVAREPDPVSGSTDMDVDNVTLSWRAGREAATHNLYFSADEQAVIDETISPVSIPADSSYVSHDTGELELGQSYYWKVNEVNEAETPATWQGDVWNFSTQEYLVVDDIEDYNDFEPDRVFDTWIDGWGDPTNGSQVGYAEPPFAEQTIVHGGKQSMPLSYDNSTASYSEATANVADLAIGWDWTKYGIKTLSLWFSGAANNVAGQMYVKVNGSKVTYDGDASNLTLAAWQPWNIELASFGMNLQSVTNLSIGIDGNGASGLLSFDDIRLYPYNRQLITPTEPSQAGLIGHWQFDEGSGNTTADSSGNGHHGTISGATWTGPGWDSTGYCLDFDGQGSDRVSVGSFDVAGNAISIACWFKADNLDTPGNDPRMISKAIAGSNQDHWFMVSSSRVGDEKRLRFRLKTDGDTGELKAGPGGTIETDVWTHVAATWDGETMRIHKNGVEVGSLAKGGTLSTDSTVKVAIGNQPADTGDRPFDGLIDDVRIYDQALSQEEIMWLAGRTKPFDKPF